MRVNKNTLLPIYLLSFIPCCPTDEMHLSQFTLLVALGATQASALWPIPRSLQTGTSFVKLASTFDIVLDGISSPPGDLTDAIARTKYHLTNDKLERLVVGRGAADQSDVAKASSLSALKLSLSGAVSSIMDEAIKPLGTRAEAYSLSIPADGGSATITANSTLGLFRGLTTFEQLFYFDGKDAVYTYQAPVTITDSPAYVRAYLETNLNWPNFLNNNSPTVDLCWIPPVTCTSLAIWAI